MVSHYFDDQQTVVTHLDAQRCISKDKEEEENMVLNNDGFKLLKKKLLCFMRKEIYSTH